MNWKNKKKIRLSELEILETERKKLAKLNWQLMSKTEKEQLRKEIDFSWDKIPGYAKAKMYKDDYIKFEIQEHCVNLVRK
ncbi:MAG: hypothetical protein WBG30_08815 [Psychrilyobacter sp.]|uniref:hypothetical protein n=1 Tax=Psychrilyobacter sp. TaxID=2586924 RepID=UPI003C727B07